MSLLERSLAIAHVMGLTSVAFPLIGTGAKSYPTMEVVQAMLDACSFCRQKGSPLERIFLCGLEQCIIKETGIFALM